MRHAIATVCLSGTLEEKLDAAAAAGFEGVELFEPDLLGCPLAPEELRERLAELSLQLSLYQPFRDFDTVSSDRLAANLRRAERKLSLMQRLGADLMLVCSSVAGDAVDDDRLAARQLRELAQLAAEHGVRIAYEALAWGRHVDGFEHSWRIVAEADHPNLGVCLDSFHILARGDDPAPIRDIPGERIFFVQLADAPRLAMDVLQWSRHHRCLPGQGAFALDAFVGHVLAAGYQGPLSLEVFSDVLRQSDPGAAAVDAMRSLVGLEDGVARRSPRPLGGAARPQLRELPAAPALGGYEFVELAVDPICEPSVGDLLGALGFARAGLHRSKPVELWSNGGTHVVLNLDRRAMPEHVDGIAEVSTLAVRSADPERSAARAQRLLAGRLARRRGPREAHLAAVAAPDGVAVFLCRSDGSGPARRWTDDFVTRELEVPARPALTGVDHVALPQPVERFDETLLFYRLVLGLEPLEPHELASPHGMVRSRALAAPDGGVRLVLNVPLLGGPRGLQHVAFACDDALAAAAGMRERGVPTLPISDNYYEDLAARLEVPEPALERMRELGVCYDRDERGGELLHFFTPLAGARLFFEVVQRRGGYPGYGAANSAVRMSAQHEWLEALAPTPGGAAVARL